MIMFLVIVTVCLLTIYVLLLAYYYLSWIQIPWYSPKSSIPVSVSISVVIPARNEAGNIEGLLEALSYQDYPKHLYEVFVVDDFSTDDTAGITKQFPGVQLLCLHDFVPGDNLNSYKKKAIEVGIGRSHGELIVTTDADCFMPPGWLSHIAAFYRDHQPSLIVMPVAIDCSNKPIEIFQALDFLALQGITGAAVHRNVLSMCNGANLAYTRKAFEAVNGFKGIDNIASGDDMLLMHKIAMQYPDGIRYLKSPEVIVQTAPVNSIKDFFNQRIRWASKADKYEDKRIFWILFLVYLFNVALFVIPFLNVLAGDWDLIKYWLIIMAVKTLAELFFLFPVAKFFNKAGLLFVFPLAQPFHIIYTVIAGWLGKFGSYEWKNRKVK